MCTNDTHEHCVSGEFYPKLCRFVAHRPTGHAFKDAIEEFGAAPDAILAGVVGAEGGAPEGPGVQAEGGPFLAGKRLQELHRAGLALMAAVMPRSAARNAPLPLQPVEGVLGCIGRGEP